MNTLTKALEAMKGVCGIYRMTNTQTGKFYIGISVEVTLTGNDEVSAKLDGLTTKAAHLADMLARAERAAGQIALPVHDTAKQYPSTKVGDSVTYHVAGEKLPRKISTKAPQRAPAKKTRTR